MIERAQSEAVEGATLHDREGDALGQVRQVYADRDSGRPEWAVVELEGGDRFVPLFPATLDERGVHVPVEGALVASSPHFDGDAGNLSAADEGELYAHYGYAPDGSRLEDATEAEQFSKVTGGPDPTADDGLTDAERIQLETNVEASEGYLDDDQRSVRARAEHNLDAGRAHERTEPGPDITEVAR